MEKKKRRYECVGGPLCGSKVGGGHMIEATDSAGRKHYYRRIRLITDDQRKLAIFYHYFGTNHDIASSAHPRLIPGRKCFRPL